MSELPQGWEWSTVGEVTLPIEKHDPRQWPDTEIEYIDIGGIDGDRLRIESTKQYLGSEAPSRARQLVQSGDTVLSTVRVNLTKTALVPPSLDGATASTGFSVLRPCEAVLPEFLFHYVTHRPFVNSLAEQQTGSSYPAVRDRDVRAMPFPVAPLPEQHRIAAAIGEHFSRLDAADRLLEIADFRTLRLQEAAVETALAGDWPEEPLSSRTVEQRYGSSAKAVEEGDVPVLRMGNIRDGRLDYSNLKYLPGDHVDVSELQLRDGDLLFNRTNSAELVGKSAVFRETDGPVIFASYLIRARLDDSLDAEWASTFINSRAGRRYIDSVVTQQVGQANVNGTKLKNFPMPVPPIETQRARIAQLEEQRAGVADLRAEIERARMKLAALRRSVLAAGFSGRLVPQDPTDEPAAALLARIAAERAAAKPFREKRVSS